MQSNLNLVISAIEFVKINSPHSLSFFILIPRYERYFLSSECASIIETLEVDKFNYNEFQERMNKLDKVGFKPPKPKNN